MEFIEQEVLEILDETFPDGMPPSRVDAAIRTRQVRLIKGDDRDGLSLPTAA